MSEETPQPPLPAECLVDEDGRPICPACRGVGVERKQKWHCSRCGLLLMTCCD